MFLEISKPEWSPPAWLFAPVWSVLYVTIAVSGWLGWRSGADMIYYSVQLVLNFAWSFIYFYLGNISLAFADICVLLIFILIVMQTLKNIQRQLQYFLSLIVYGLYSQAFLTIK